MHTSNQILLLTLSCCMAQSYTISGSSNARSREVQHPDVGAGTGWSGRDPSRGMPCNYGASWGGIRKIPYRMRGQMGAAEEGP